MAEVLQRPSLLIALPTLLDPNFQKAVILLVEHSQEGAFGLVLNKKTNIPLTEILTSQVRRPIPEDLYVWTGGPVESQTGLILACDEKASFGYSLTADPEVLESMLIYEADSHEKSPSKSALKSQSNILYPYRFLIGYTGWGAGQLNDEMRRGAWIETPFDRSILFNTPKEDIWYRAMNVLGCSPNSLVSHSQSYLH